MRGGPIWWVLIVGLSGCMDDVPASEPEPAGGPAAIGDAARSGPANVSETFTGSITVAASSPFAGCTGTVYEVRSSSNEHEFEVGPGAGSLDLALTASGLAPGIRLCVMGPAGDEWATEGAPPLTSRIESPSAGTYVLSVRAPSSPTLPVAMTSYELVAKATHVASG